MTSVRSHPMMAWTNKKLKVSCTDGIGFKAIWKMIMLDNNNHNTNSSSSNSSGTNKVGVFLYFIFHTIEYCRLKKY